MIQSVGGDNEGENGSECTENDDLSEHAISMRQAARYCLSIMSSLDVLLSAPDWSAIRSCLDKADWDNLDLRKQRRTKVYHEFWHRNGSSNNTNNNDNADDSITIPKLCCSEISPQDFVRRFHHDNLPCLIDLNESSSERYFDYVNEHWRNEGPTRRLVNRKWFLDVLGADTLVPVRFQPLHESATLLLDKDGRANECLTKSVPLSEWVDYLEHAEGADADDEQEYRSADPSSLYLKDWHLQLQSLHSLGRDLYHCPTIFEYDLLNQFQSRFTKGDYRFCYWGPKGSFTSRHSDVLHSFSWSYNVIGTKRWTFFQEANDSSEELTMVVIQRAGQAMFVPSRWQHEVINLEETISVNHNWITAANIDLCWECLQAEISAIDSELDAWGIHDNSEAQESMLRGCVGLDTTAFVLMVMVRLCDLLVAWKDEYAVEFLILREMLGSVVVRGESSIDVESRLVGVLQCHDLASGLLRATQDILLL
jgi:JmjC domain, hydroxylase